MTTEQLRTAAVQARDAAREAAQAHIAHRRACEPCTLGNPAQCQGRTTLADAARTTATAAAQALAVYAPPGTVVTYHGPHTVHHGAGWTVHGLYPGAVGLPYILRRGGHTLGGVCLDSITRVRHVPAPADMTEDAGLPAVRLTAAAWADCVAWDQEREGCPQDEDGRLWDVLVQAHAALWLPHPVARLGGAEWAPVPLYRVPAGGWEPERTELRMRADWDGPDEALVLTVALPDEPEPGDE